MKQTLSLEEIYLPIEGRLSRVSKTLLEILSTPNELTDATIHHFFSRQGTFLRPALTFFGALIEEQNPLSPSQEEKLLRLGASLEIFHSATLIHDDIIDSAYLRRNIPTINTKWNSQVAVLVGDYLHDKALAAIFGLEHPKVMSRFLETAGMVCDGEIHELREKNNFKLKEEDYFQIIREKTASLIACCIESGGLLADYQAEKTETLKRFGWAFGTAFQIVDDCLDFTGAEHEFGKTLGADCEAGVLTLPLIHLLKQVNEHQKSEVIHTFKSSSDAKGFKTLRELLEEHGSLEYAMKRAKEFTEEARNELSLFSDSAVKRSLNSLLDYVLERNR